VKFNSLDHQFDLPMSTCTSHLWSTLNRFTTGPGQYTSNLVHWQ